ncbi:alpha-galactosidase [Novosphingobium rosa]|uniref:alpha-galactosidase n=1 Tax=Novosphingobium rosa TaxID=76978 RepID=UPI001FDF8664|nr:alpha-galactosidase [Novosphingobium rosa]
MTTSVLLALAMPSLACAKVSASADGRQLRLDGGGVTYAMGVDEQGYLQPLYWGPALGADAPLVARHPAELSGFDPAGSVTPQEYAGQGEGLVSEPGLKVAFADGNRDLVLKYRSHSIAGETLTVELSDIRRPLTVTLRYTIDPATGIIARSATVHNGDRRPVRVDQIAAATYTLPAGGDYRLHYLTGRHGAEWSQQEAPVTPALTLLESRRGSTGHGNQPWFALEKQGQSSQTDGPVWFGALAWSGSFRLSVGLDNLGRPRIGGGYNPYDFSWTLKAGESLETPVFYAGFTDHGMGDASRRFHTFQRAHIIPGGDAARLRPVLYNSWEATAFNVTESGQMALAEKAAKIGIERFVVDDGWFGARDDDKAGLGDWSVNRRKFPNGLGPLIGKVKALGMDFGLWVEPEMVNVKSDLYRAHPDWVMNFPDRPRTEGRNQLVLNLARKDVRDHILDVLDRLVSENDIAFLKWDYNRNWTEPGWPGVAIEDQQRLQVQYIRNLYFILSELRRRHPGLEIEGCSGGGGRIDLGMMALTDESWISDNTDPYDRLTIQDGFTQAYAPSAMMAWVTDSPNWANGRETSLDFRFLSAMQGSLGIGANLDHWTEADFASAQRWIAAYKTVRRTVQRGDLYRLISPAPDAATSATFYVSQDRKQAVLFAMLHSSQYRDNGLAIHPQGLAPDTIYRLSVLGGAPLPDGLPAEAQGSFWMAQGLRFKLKGDYKGVAIVFEAKPDHAPSG